VKKYLGILFAVVLVVSLMLVPAVVSANPDTIQVDVNDAGCVTGSGQSNPYSVVYCSIQDAIDDAAPYDTINVAAGIYEEEIKIMDKSLTLLGAQADVPIVDTTRAGDESIIRGRGTGRSYPRWIYSWCVIRIQHSDVVVNGFTIENGQRAIAIQGSSIRREGISNILVSYNYIKESGYASYHAGIFRDNAAADVTITHNYIASNPRGIATNGGATTITDNTFYGNGKGIDFHGGDPYSVYFTDYAEPKYPTIISGNTFTDDSTSITLRLDKCHQFITITGNDITEARSAAIKTWNVYDVDIVEPAIHYNSIWNNEFGIDNQVAEINLDATMNWWGDCSGPSGFGPGTGDAVSDYVGYDPWLGQQLCALKTAISGLSDEDFNKPNAATDQRQALLDKIDAVCDQYGDGAYRGALNKLQYDVTKRIEKWIVLGEQGALIAKVDAEITILLNFQ